MAWTRWYILTAYSCVATQFMTNWFLFGSITKEATAYYNLSVGETGSVNPQIARLLSLGPMIFLILSPFAVYTLRIPIFGLQRAIRIAAASLLVGMILICMPTFLSAFDSRYEITGSFSNTMIWLYLGAIISNFSSPFILSSPAKVSVMWFGENERNTITGFASNVNQLGECLMYFIPPLIVQQSSDLPHLLIFALCTAFLNCIMVFLYFPPHPKKFPTLASEISTMSFLHSMDPKSGSIDRDATGSFESVNSLILDPIATKNGHHAVNGINGVNGVKAVNGVKSANGSVNGVHSKSISLNGSVNGLHSKLISPNGSSNGVMDGYKPLIEELREKNTFREYMLLLIHDWKQLFNIKTNRSCVLLLLAAGCNHGATGGWSSILQDMMSPVGLSQRDIGYIGAAMMIAQVVGALISGPIVDRYFSGKLKRVIMTLQCIDIIWFAIACLVLPNRLWGNGVILKFGASATFVVLWILAVIIGLTYGMILPLFSEILAEVAYPVPEASSSNAVFLIGLPMMILMIQIGSINTSITSPLALGLVIIAFALNHFVVERYGRPKHQ